MINKNITEAAATYLNNVQRYQEVSFQNKTRKVEPVSQVCTDTKPKGNTYKEGNNDSFKNVLLKKANQNSTLPVTKERDSYESTISCIDEKLNNCCNYTKTGKLEID